MEDLVIKSVGASCRLRANKDLISTILKSDFTSHYIPDFERGVSYDSCDVFVEEKPSILKKAEIDFPNAVFLPGVEFRSIVSMADYLMERVRQEKNGVYCLNSATATRGDSAVTFWGGATNLGKTSSMLELVMSKGYEFYSDERTLLDLHNLRVVGGSRTIATRKQVLKTRMGNAAEFHKHPVNRGTKRTSLFIYPHLDHGLAEPIFYQFTPKDFHWLLSREFGCNIRGAIKFIDDYSYPLPSIDTQELAEKRASETMAFTKKVPCFYFQGSLAQTVLFVEEFFQRNN